MKNFIMKLLLVFAVFIGIFAFAQAPTEPTVAVSTFKNDMLTIFVPAILASLAVLLSDASKHFSSPDWSWSIFFHTKITKFLIITGIALLIVILHSFVPGVYSSITSILGEEFNTITSITLFGLATALYDNFSKKNK